MLWSVINPEFTLGASVTDILAVDGVMEALVAGSTRLPFELHPCCLQFHRYSSRMNASRNGA